MHRGLAGWGATGERGPLVLTAVPLRPMGRSDASRAQALAARLVDAAALLIAVLERVDEPAWRHTPGSATWSIGKDAEHVAEAAVYHQWIVRKTIGQAVGSRRPMIERKQLVPDRSVSETVAMIRERTDAGARLTLALTDAQLDLPTCPPRAQGQRLAETIERVLIGHYDAHRMNIEAKLGAMR